MVLYPGMNPMETVATPITSSETTNVFFLPNLSPKCPNKNDPNGRATKATPNVKRLSKVANNGVVCGKKTDGKYAAEAVPYA